MSKIVVQCEIRRDHNEVYDGGDAPSCLFITVPVTQLSIIMSYYCHHPRKVVVNIDNNHEQWSDMLDMIHDDHQWLDIGVIPVDMYMTTYHDVGTGRFLIIDSRNIVNKVVQL